MIREETKELIHYRLERSKSTLRAATLLHEQEQNLDAINRAYYSCFYAVLALLLLENHAAKSHSGIRTMFHKHWVLTERIPSQYGKVYNELFDMRHEDDYDDFASITPELTSEMIAKAQDFINNLESIINTEISTNNEQ
ncbi:MAG: HEPN domain-containing protein [Candidatus Kapabacteria bacterium]|jgi:uncharacterized protein (UPF0332 family)|nr:HEPN domain-containing protein [Candidatus Kapabacteria bacterium]